MKKLALLILILFSISTFNFAQKAKNNRVTNDTLLLKLLQDVPKKQQKKFIREYNKMSPRGKEFIALIASLPKSSKNELINNYDNNYSNILKLKKEYEEIIPYGYNVYIEFALAEKNLERGQSIDFCVSKIDSSGNGRNIIQEWNVDITSIKLDSLMQNIGIDRLKLEKIKIALKNANCISIQNGKETEIGFARSGMGKYSYLIFEDNLNEMQIEQHNNGCDYIYYKDNIVLMYGGGAIGPQCFPD